MKTSRDPRHKKRQEIVKILFAESFSKQPNHNSTVSKIVKNLTTIDNVIASIAPEFPIDKINRIDLAILRLGVYEILVDRSQPQKVIIDESIELAKEFSGASSASFINGALGKLVKEFPTYESTKV